ncbi:glycosyltransferase family 1 protein [Sphingobium sp. AN641]|uniref:glycosyltransferase family 1 protein n=1 Tax=Sphingobium sp. AN641 TaxID=3133443 RepID=UPI0030C02EE0
MLHRVVGQFNRLRRRYRSAGVPVSADVHRLISIANTARSDENWPRAAEFYQKALDRDHSLSHIWIQLGHALKEQGFYEPAAAAYAQAEALNPDDSDAAVQQGHVAKLRHLGVEATRHFLRAHKQNRNDPNALRELLALVERGNDLSRESLIKILQGDGAAGERRNLKSGVASDDDPVVHSPGALAHSVSAKHDQALVFDASDLISYFGNARLPTGIQRVQIATIAGALKNRPAGSVYVCCFSDQGDSWTQVPVDGFERICALAVVSGDRTDPEWLDAYVQLKLEIALAPPFDFPDEAFLINLGTSWWLQNYFMFVREAKRLHNIRYVPFVHDFIPIKTPEHCIKQLTQDFISWALGVYQHADFFLANSEATKRDLIQVAGILGHDVDPQSVSVIPLNARFGSPEAKTAPVDRLDRWNLAPGKFILFVSTIESRKNHVGALDAWVELIKRHGIDNVPKLVCLGNRGWLNDAVYARIEQSALLRQHVVMLQGLSDDELALLYRTCRFTLYPSNYEGWGLPVTESLCYGKVPLISDSSSLPEAGGDFAVYFPAGSTDDLIAKAELLIFDDAELQRLEAKIAAEFEPREWEDIADQISSEIGLFLARGAQAQVPKATTLNEPVKLGVYYPLGRNLQTRIWPGLASAEIYRSGTGWWWPDDWGCWTKPRGGELAFRFTDSGPLRAFVRIHAPPDNPSDFTVSSPEFDILVTGIMKPGEERWISFDLPHPVPAEGLRLIVRGSNSVDIRERTAGLDPRVIALGVAGFYFSRADDMHARLDFLEAVALGSLDQIAFNREPRP